MAQSAVRNSDAAVEIGEANQQFMTAFQQRDAARVASLYVTNALLLPPGTEAIEGTDGIAQFWKGAMEMGITEVRLETVSVEEMENSALEIGRYTLMAGTASVDSGKYLVLWRLDGGAWKLYRDIWNSSK